MAPKTAAPRTEKGYVNGNATQPTGWGGWSNDPFEDNAACLWPKSVNTYAQMARRDARVSSVLRALGLPIRRTQWRIRSNGASDEVTKFVARNLGLPVEGENPDEPTPRVRDRFSWSQHLQLALTAQQFGHAIFEQVYRLEGSGPTMRAVLHKLAPRPQSTIAYFDVARDGGLRAVQQWPAGTFTAPGMFVQTSGQMGDAIPVDRLVVYVRDPEPGVWTGNSLLRPAYKHWQAKDELMRIEIAAARRHGVGVPWLKGNESDSEDPVRMDELLAVASAYSGGSSAGMALTDGEEAGIMSPQGTPMDPRRAIEYHDHAIATVALAHFLNLDGKGGSYALASVQADTFVQSVQTVANDIRDTAQAHIVEDLVDVNWGPDEPTPLLVFDEIGSRQDATAAALQMLVNARLLTPDDRLEAFLRQASGLPGADPETEHEEPEPPAAPPVADPPPEAEPKNRIPVRAHTRRKTRTDTNGAPTLWD